jgi:carbamoyl-phosphate synthase large subunit
MLTYSLKQADDYIITPCIYDKEYINFLLKFCNEKSVNVIISLFDIDLPILSRNIKRFENIGVRLIISNEKAIEICNDKWKTYRFLSSIGLKQPKTYISINACNEDLDKGKIKFPLILKPRWGTGSIGIFEIDTKEEIDILYKKLHRIIFNSYLRFESNQDIDSCIVIQEKLIGKEFGLDILNDLNGVYVITVAKQKLAMRSGETDIAQIIDSSLFVPVSKIIAESLNHIGNLDVDCFITENKEIYVLEINCRFGGQYPFSHLSGVDFPAQIIRWCNNEETDEKLLQFQEGLLLTKDLIPVVM